MHPAHFKTSKNPCLMYFTWKSGALYCLTHNENSNLNVDPGIKLYHKKDIF